MKVFDSISCFIQNSSKLRATCLCLHKLICGYFYRKINLWFVSMMWFRIDTTTRVWNTITYSVHFWVSKYYSLHFYFTFSLSRRLFPNLLPVLLTCSFIIELLYQTIPESSVRSPFLAHCSLTYLPLMSAFYRSVWLPFTILHYKTAAG